jgi:signal transduction histidine kinase
MRSFANPSLPIFLAMAVCETVGALWISGLMCLYWPWLERKQAALWGSMAYGLLMALSVHHARAFLRSSAYDPWADRCLRWGAWCWWLGLPTLVMVDSAGMRSALLYAGSVHSACLLYLAWRSYVRYKRAYMAMYVAVWVVYLLSVGVYWLYRWFEWPLVTTLGAQFVQGAVVATLLGWSGCLQVLQHRHALQVHLERSLERSRLYAAAQHDLWQPLQSMQLYARSLMAASVDQQTHLLKGLQLASLYVDDFMHSLRYLADGKVHALSDNQYQDCLLDSVLSDVLQEFKPYAQMRQVQLRCRTGRQSVRVHVPSLQRIVRNLLSNALRYGSAGGKILLGTRPQGELLWLWCIDNGQGMTPEQTAACFQAFASVERDAHIPQSLGLGLYSVKQLSLQMNSPLRLHTQPGKGVAIAVGLQLTSSVAPERNTSCQPPTSLSTP